jgi:DNA-binding HxlR family transcriptional regulator
LAAPALSLESAVRNLSEWQRRHLPGIHTPPGKAVLAHLIETWSEQTSFTNLRKSTGFSETTIRHALNQFVALGLVKIHKDQFSSRQRGIAATPKLKECLEEYAVLISRVIALHESR